MTREQAKANLVSVGIENPTEEQVTNYLNQISGETKRANDRADKYKADAEKMLDLQKQLDEISNQNLSDIEKANKATDEANSKVAELESTIKKMELKTKLAEKGIIGEQADKLLEGLSGGSIDVEILGQIISDREKAAATAKETEIANGSTNPGGGSNNNGGGEKSLAEKMVSEIYGAKKQDNNILSNYALGGN